MMHLFELAGLARTMWPVFAPRLWVVLVAASRFVRFVMMYMFGLAVWPVLVPHLWVVLVVTSRIRNELFFVYPQSTCFSVR
jgi:hypothetical protein